MSIEAKSFEVNPDTKIITYKQFIDSVVSGSSNDALQVAAQVLNRDLRLRRDPQYDISVIEQNRQNILGDPIKKWTVLVSAIPRLQRLVSQSLITPDMAVTGLRNFEEKVINGWTEEKIRANDVEYFHAGWPAASGRNYGCHIGLILIETHGCSTFLIYKFHKN